MIAGIGFIIFSVINNKKEQKPKITEKADETEDENAKAREYYIQKTRKDGLANTASDFITVAMVSVNANLISANQVGTLYLIPLNNNSEKTCITFEKGGVSPFHEEWTCFYAGTDISFVNFIGLDQCKNKWVIKYRITLLMNFKQYINIAFFLKYSKMFEIYW